MRRIMPQAIPVLAAIAILVIAGCGSEEVAEVPVDVAPPSVAETKGPEPAPPQVAKAQNIPPAASEESQPTITTTAASYEAPFPNRTDPFEAPKQARSSVRTGDEDEDDAIELNGFVLVDTPRAILSIDGQIVLLPEGGERYGVEVISIDSPRVILQRGGTRWTATLE